MAVPCRDMHRRVFPLRVTSVVLMTILLRLCSIILSLQYTRENSSFRRRACGRFSPHIHIHTITVVAAVPTRELTSPIHITYTYHTSGLYSVTVRHYNRYPVTNLHPGALLRPGVICCCLHLLERFIFVGNL